MDKQRFTLFLVFAICLFFMQMWLARLIWPTPATPPTQQAATPVKKPPTGTPPVMTVPPPPEVAERFTLGSMDSDSNYRMLVTMLSTGAAVERVELNSPLYRDQELPGGYLGELAGVDADPKKDGTEGCKVQVVGKGTPAAAAKCDDANLVGLLPGDIITQASDAKIASAQELRDHLRKETKPGESLVLLVQRKVDGADKQYNFTVQLGYSPMSVIQPEADFAPASAGKPSDPLSFLCTLQKVDSVGSFLPDSFVPTPELLKQNWHGKQISEREVEFTLEVADPHVKVIKRYRLAEIPEDQKNIRSAKAYHLVMDLEIENLAKTAETFVTQVHGPTGLPLEGWWYINKTHPTHWSSAGTRDVIWSAEGKGHTMQRAPTIADPNLEGKPVVMFFDAKAPLGLSYAGVDSPYFVSALMPASNDAKLAPQVMLSEAVLVGTLDKEYHKRSDVSCRLTLAPRKIEAGQKITESFMIFAGPKANDVLAEYGLGSTVVYGWFSVVARAMLGILHIFYAIVGNYGLAIVMLTVLVRACMMPLSRKAAKNAAKMAELAPEMKKIKEKYKEPEKQMQAQRELWAKNNYNPLGGCLLAFLQLPIFIGLYKGLSTDIELRQAPLIPGLDWCTNLAAPDRLLDWDGFMPAFITRPFGFLALGPYFNLLPIVTIVLFIVQQKLFTPPATDDTTRAQQKIMKVMMIVVGLMFFKVPAGLCIYFIVSSTWGIAERLLLPKPKAKLAVTGTGGEVTLAPSVATKAEIKAQADVARKIEETKRRRKENRKK